MDLWPQMKRTWLQAQIEQDIAISTESEHERHSTHKRGSYSIFTKRRHPQAYISQSYQEHSYTSYEHHKKSHILISSISWANKEYERTTSLWHMLQMQSMIQGCKHDMIQKWKCSMHMYINPLNRSSKRKNNSKLSSQTSKCSLFQRLG
jgi:hypothetical protein